MLEVVTTFDVDWMAGMSYGFFNLNYVDAKTVETELSAIFADPKSPLGTIVRLIPLARLTVSWPLRRSRNTCKPSKLGSSGWILAAHRPGAGSMFMMSRTAARRTWRAR